MQPAGLASNLKRFERSAPHSRQGKKSLIREIDLKTFATACVLLCLFGYTATAQSQVDPRPPAHRPLSPSNPYRYPGDPVDPTYRGPYFGPPTHLPYYQPEPIYPFHHPRRPQPYPYPPPQPYRHPSFPSPVYPYYWPY